MDTETVYGNEIVVGNCDKCNEKRVLLRYRGEAYCCTCIRNDDYLSSVLRYNS
jgi:uncharacterized Zn finger protein (UPF0148 family)